MLLKIKKIKSNLTITPRIISRVLIGLAILGFLFYLLHQVLVFISPPKLEIISPKDDLKINQGTVVIEGRTEKDVSLSINEQVVYLDNQGKFSVEINLQPGLNELEITSTNRRGKSRAITRYILYEG